MLDQKQEQLSKLSKRKFIVGSAAVAASTQVKWVEPIVNSVILPAHAQTSVAATAATPAVAGIYSLAYAETALDPAGSNNLSCVQTYTAAPAVVNGNTGQYTQRRIVSFTVTNNSNVAVTLAPITFPAPASGTLTITRTDAAQAVPIPVGGFARFDAVLDEGPFSGIPSNTNVLNTPTACTRTITGTGITDPQPVPNTPVNITITINEDPVTLNETITFAGLPLSGI